MKRLRFIIFRVSQYYMGNLATLYSAYWKWQDWQLGTLWNHPVSYNWKEKSPSKNEICVVSRTAEFLTVVSSPGNSHLPRLLQRLDLKPKRSSTVGE